VPELARLAVGAVAAVRAAGTLGSGGDDSDPSGGSGPRPGGSGSDAGWEEGACVRQTAGPAPEDIPPAMPAGDRGVVLAQQQFQPVDCSDDRRGSSAPTTSSHPTPPRPATPARAAGELIEGDCLAAGDGTSPGPLPGR
jgi:hypothetical protein